MPRGQRQCPEGVDANPDSFAHWPHHWQSEHGWRYCRGWFPLVSCRRGDIKYEVPDV